MDIPTLRPVVTDALAASRRRLALSVLSERDATTSTEELAAAVAERERAASPTGTEESTAAEVRASLHHVHLPALARVSAVRFDPETGLAAASAEPPFDREWICRLLADHPDRKYDGVLTALASLRRQAVLYALLTGSGPVSEAELAVTVAAYERECEPGDVPDAIRRIVRLSLSHTHLPHLSTVGFVSYDETRGAVHPERMPWRRDGWVRASPIGEWAAED